jgi:hypothetical protein
MSRGFGALQRDILALCPGLQGRGVEPSLRFYDARGHRYPTGAVIDVPRLKRQLARPGPGFDAAFSRAVRTLVTRGALVPVTMRLPPDNALDWPRRRRLYVVQAPT